MKLLIWLKVEYIQTYSESHFDTDNVFKYDVTPNTRVQNADDNGNIGRDDCI